MSTEQNKQIMRRVLLDIWNRGDLAAAEELFAPDSFSPSAPYMPPGPEATKVLVSMFRNAMPDYRIDIDILLADENKVVARFTQSGTHTGEPLMGMPASGRRAEWTEIAVLEIKNGQIVKSWYEPDILGMINQLNPQSA